MHHTLGFRRDQALVVELGEDLRFNDLGFNDIGNDRDHRLIGIDDRTFFKRVDVSVETESLQIIQEFITVKVQTAEIVHIVFFKMQVRYIIDDLFQSRKDRKTAPVRDPAEKNVESNLCASHLWFKKITVGHGHFIKIHYHRGIISFRLHSLHYRAPLSVLIGILYGLFKQKPENPEIFPIITQYNYTA